MNEFGYGSEQDPKGESPWRGLRPDGLTNEIVTQSFNALKTLGLFLNEFEGALLRHIDDGTGPSLALEAIRMYRKPLSCILGEDHSSLVALDIPGVKLAPSFLKQTTDMCVNTCEGGDKSVAQALQEPETDTEGEREQEGKKEQDGGKDGKKTARIQQAVNDILVWRALLVYLLFSTSLDNTSLLDFGIWDHIIPIL